MQVRPFAFAPGVRSYTATLLMLYLIALRMGEARGSITTSQATDLRHDLRTFVDVMEATIQGIDPLTGDLAEQVKEESNFVFVGGSPNYGTALFSAAKVMEAAGRHAVDQDTEEWSHLQYFVREAGTPTFLVSPAGHGYSRAAELVGVMKRLGRTVIAIVPEGDQEIAPQADVVLPVKGEVREEFSPLAYCTAAELFAAHLTAVLKEQYFRGFAGPWSPETGGNLIRTSATLTEVPR